MSLWYSCTFAAIGTDAEVEKLNAGCGSYWHHARVEKRLSPGFIQIQASRNFGAHDATEKMVADFPDLMFVGSLYTDQDLGNDYIDKDGDVDNCQWWRFHALKGFVGWHEMPDSPTSEVEDLTPEPSTAQMSDYDIYTIFALTPDREALWAGRSTGQHLVKLIDKLLLDERVTYIEVHDGSCSPRIE
jgi:hypothetical protein